MTPFHQSLRGSLHPDTAQKRLDYWQGIARARTATIALDEARGAPSALGGIGPIPAASYGRIERYFDELIEAQIAFAQFQLKERTREAASSIKPAAVEAPAADHTPDHPRPQW